MEYLTIEFASAWTTTLQKARRFTEEEKQHYVEWYREYGFVGIGDHIKLAHINSMDAPQRPADGEFNGCGNQAYIITQEEWDAYIALNAQREVEKQKAVREERREYYQSIVDLANRQGGPLTVEEASRRRKDWNATQNEGGEGYVPHYVTIQEYDAAKKWLAENAE